MRNPLPVQEIREILGEKGFIRLYGQDTVLYVSDAPRRVSEDTLSGMLETLRERGWIAEVDTGGLLLIDLQPARWEALLDTFQTAGIVPLPRNETLHGVYALARLLSLHSAEFASQPMGMVRAVFKRYARKEGLTEIAPRLHALCAQKLRRGEPLPSKLAKVLYTWLAGQT